MKKAFALLLCLLMLGSFAACSSGGASSKSEVGSAALPASEAKSEATAESAGEPLKVALCVSGPVNDGGFCAAAYAGLVQAEEEYGIESSYSENVAITDIEAIFTDYASQGYDLIIGHGFQFGDPALAVGELFPETKFVCINATVSAENVASYAMGMQDGTYLMGVLAASMTESGKIGMVAGLEGPSQIKLVEGYKAGARSVNPDIEIFQAYTGSFTDIAKAKEAAEAMVSNGADILSHCANQAGMGAIKAAEEAGILATGDSVDQNSVSPDTVMCSTIYNIPKLVFTAIGDVQNGTFKGELYELGMADGIVSIAPYHGFEDKIPQEVKDKIAELEKEITSGAFKVPKVETITD